MFATDTENARSNMIEQQIRPCEVIDERVLQTLRNVPRENFVPEQYRNLAFADIHVPLNAHSVMMKPLQEGAMLQALDIQPGDRVLEIGTGSGFVTACLRELGGEVTSYEIDAELSARAGEALHALSMDEVMLRVGDIFEVALEPGAYDAIAVTGSIPVASEKLLGLLAKGGRMYVIEGEDPAMCAKLITRSENDEIEEQKLLETSLPALQNAPQAEKFSF